MTLDDALQRNAVLGAQLQRSHEELRVALLTIDKLKVELAYLRRMRYGRSSEKLEHAQLELVGGEVMPPAVEAVADAANAGIEPDTTNVTPIDNARRKRPFRPRPELHVLPAHLPRRTVVHWPAGHEASCGCLTCGAALREIGQDVSEVLDYEPGSFHVVRHVRPKLACGGCRTVTQASAPARPIERVMAGAGMLAHVLVSKYADHAPLYRQTQIYARDGVLLHRSTLTDWVGQTARLLTPLAEAVGRYVLAAAKVHGDDTPIRALGGKGAKVHTGRLWVYVRDDRSSGSKAAPAVWFQYSPNRQGEHPQRHLRTFHGVLQADAFAGYNALYDDEREGGPIIEAGCWSHVRRKAWDIHERQKQVLGLPAADPALGHVAEEVHVSPAVLGRRVGKRPAALHHAPQQEPLGLALVLLGGQRRASARCHPGPDGRPVVGGVRASCTRWRPVRALRSRQVCCLPSCNRHRPKRCRRLSQ